MVEVPSALLVESVKTDEGDSSKDLLIDHHEAVLIPQTLLTSSCGNTLNHLRSLGGRLARYRGFAIYAVYAFLFSQLTCLLAFLMPYHLAAVLAGTALCNMRMAWTHIVITAPSTKPWYRRLPTAKTFRAVAGVTALTAIAEEITVGLPVFLWAALGLNNMHAQEDKADGELSSCLMKMFGVAVIGLCWIVCALVPMTAVLARVQASLLAETEETVISVLREEPMGIKAAWKSLDCSTFARVFKAYGRAVVIQLALIVLLAVALSVQLAVFIGPDFKDVLKGMLPPA